MPLMSFPDQSITPVAPLEAPVEDEVESYPETWYSTLLQIVIPFCLASMGTLCAGILLGNVQDWLVFQQMNELFVLVPALCGLKGNLDMCVASRITTHSKMGQLKNYSAIHKIFIGNVALVQVQAIICSMLLTVMTVAISSGMTGAIVLKNFTTLAAAALITSSTSCMIIDSTLIIVILFSQRYRFNPDYIATPIVASIGDIVSISLLAFCSALLQELKSSNIWISSIVVFCYLIILLPFWIFLVLYNANVRKILKYGWIPVIGALCISEFGGFILGLTVEQFRGFAVFAPIINGVGGNLVSVQASNMGSIMHQNGELGKMPEGSRACESPFKVLFVGTIYSRVSRSLIFISIAGNAILVYLADYLYKSYISVNGIFVIAFLFTSLLQLMLLLWSAHFLIHMLWSWKIDPDSSAIPYLTAFGDGIGTGFLSITFHILGLTNSGYQERCKIQKLENLV